MCVYFYSLHVSDRYVPIIKRINCINTTSGLCHSVEMTVWYLHRVTYIRYRFDTDSEVCYPRCDFKLYGEVNSAIGSYHPHTYPTNKIHIHIHTELLTNPLTSHQFSLTIARRMMMRSQHHHAF